MLAATLWYVVALALLGAVALESAAALGRAAMTAAADHASGPAFDDAVASYQQRVAGAIAQLAAPAGASSAPPLDYAAALATLPDPLQVTSAADPSGTPAFTVVTTIAQTTVAPPSCDAAAPAAGADAIAWLQCGTFVDESRISVHVTVEVRDAGGAATLARRDGDLTLRLFAAPPFSAIDGRKDGAASDPAGTAGAAHEGDLGGDTHAGASPDPSPSSWPAGGTLIHRRYACTDGAGSCAGAAPPDPDASLRAGVRWSNGNVPVN